MPTSTRCRPLIPSEVRLAILEQHKRLRKRLVESQELARTVTIEPARADELRTCLRKLLVEFATHIDAEEEVLLPILADIDERGGERVATIRAEHQEQRALLRRVFDETNRETHPLDLAVRVDRLVLHIFRDMTDEERDVLNAELLRDDVIVVDQFCG